MMNAVTLRVAVLTNRLPLYWQARCVEALAAVPGVTLDRWLQAPADQSPRTARADVGALSVVPIPDVLGALRGDNGTLPTQLDLEQAQRVDILLDLTTSGLARPIRWASEVWRFGYGLTLSRDPARTALIDYVRGPGVTRVALISEPAGTIVREGWLRTESWWVGKPLESLLLDPAAWPAIAAHAKTEPWRVTNAASRSGSIETRGEGGVAGQNERAAAPPEHLLRAAAARRRVAEIVDGLVRHSDWNVGFMQAPIESVLNGSEEQAITWLPARRGHYAADPFGLVREGILHVLFEDFDQRRGRGSIGHIAIDPTGIMSDPVSVLDPGVHASYPFLVEYEDAVYMLPETSAAGELVLYEAVAFPDRWRRAVTLLSGIPAVDASVVQHAGLWWMFAGISKQGHNQNLFVWHAPRLTGPWTPHEANPVKTDARSARSGGTPFVYEGQLYRPSQDNSLGYGGRVVLNRVDVLTPAAFAERPIGFVGPRQGSRYPDGLHTLSAVGDRTLIDGNVRHFVWDAFRFKVARRRWQRRSA
jgi:hypothetical protein